MVDVAFLDFIHYLFIYSLFFYYYFLYSPSLYPSGQVTLLFNEQIHSPLCELVAGLKQSSQKELHLAGGQSPTEFLRTEL